MYCTAQTIFSPNISYVFDKPWAARRGSHSWAAYGLETGHSQRRNITVAPSCDLCKFGLHQKIMTCEPPVKFGKCVAHTINQNEKWHTKCIDSFSFNSSWVPESRRGCGSCTWIGARPWFAGWGGPRVCLHLHQWKTSVQTFMHTQAFLLIPSSVNNFIVHPKHLKALL